MWSNSSLRLDTACSVPARLRSLLSAELLDFLLPLYVEEGKLGLTIAIGCTGGRHRSVALASALHDYFIAHGVNSVNVNRDIDK